ncbi:MAG: hypothetical protein QOK16_4814, partial [Solirubrobacteraceae bacterium]|nr:hypothetical protein [Solirubrobacteraceae bacterium]
MGDSQREDHEVGVLDRVDDTVVTDPDAPQAWLADERSSAARSRFHAEAIDALGNSTGNRLIELHELLHRSRVVLDDVRPGVAH